MPRAVAADKKREGLMTKQYALATQRLREKYPDEFTALRVEASKELGLDWTPKLTPEKKAEADLNDLLERFPHLRQKLDPKPEDDEEDGVPDGDDEPPEDDDA